MRLPCWYDQSVTFFQIAGLAIFDLFRGHLTGPWLGVNRPASNDDCRAAIHDVEDVRLFLVDLDISIRGAPVGLHAVSVARN